MRPCRAAYIRLQTLFVSNEVVGAINKLVAWGISRGIYIVGGSQLLIAGGMVPDERGRYLLDVSMTLPEGMDVEEEGEIKMQHMPGGAYAVYRGIYRPSDDIVKTTEQLIMGWWVSSYFPRDLQPVYTIPYNCF